MKWLTSTLGVLVAQDNGLIQTGPFGSQLHQSDYQAEGIPVVMPKDIVEGHISVETIARVSEETVDRLTRHKLKPRSIVLPRRGEVTKRAFIVPEQEGWLCGTGCLKLELSGNKLLPEFLYYFMEQSHVSRWLEQHAVGTTMLNLSASIVADLPIFYPQSLNAQSKIASILTTYDTLIENNKRRMALLEASARLLYEEWFVRLRFPGHAQVPVVDGVPEGWARKTLASVCIEDIGIQTGPFGSQLHQSDYVDDGVPVVMPKDIIDSRISVDGIAKIPDFLAETLSRHRMMVGDTVYGRRGDIGRRAFISNRQTGWLCGTGCLRIRPDTTHIHPRFLFDTLGAPETAGTIANRAKGATMPNLNSTILKSVPILVAPRILQNHYADQVESMYAISETLSEQNQKLKVARDLLLPRLMSGEITL